MTNTTMTPPSAKTTDKATDDKSSRGFMSWWGNQLEQWLGPGKKSESGVSAKDDAKSRLKLVLMHDRTQLPPATLEKMRDELVAVIAKYVEIDKDALDLFLEQENNSIALVANIAVVRMKTATS